MSTGNKQEVFRAGPALEAIPTCVPLSAPTMRTFEPVGAAFFRHIDDVKRGKMPSFTDVNHSYEAAMHEEPTKTEETTGGDDDYVDIGSGEWKDQDHYELLGLENLRWRASEEDIKRAYKKQVLKYHPDKRGAMTPDQLAKTEAQFNCVVKAFELLSDPAKRRLYDSIDDFDDTVPPVTQTNKDKFFEVFSPVVLANSRWHVKQPAPLLGDENTPIEEVLAFYEAWYNAESWRSFGYYDEQDPNNAESRDEKRWIIKNNLVERKKKKKAENARMIKLVDNLYACDPRIRKHKQQEKEAKEAAKKAREDAKLAALAKKLEAEKAAEEAKAQAALDEKKRKEAERLALKAAIQAFMDRCEAERYFVDDPNPHSLEREASKIRLQTHFGKFSMERLAPYTSITDAAEFKEAVLSEMRAVAERATSAAAKAAAAKPTTSASGVPTEWTKDELKVLVRAVKELPAGTRNRYERIAEFVHTHAHTTWTRTEKDVIGRLKNLQHTAETQKQKANEDAFEAFATGKTKDRSNPSESVPTERDATAAASGERPWTTDEQKALEAAMRQVGKDDPERWAKVAALVPGRTKADCIKRCKELQNLIKAKKAGEATATQP